MVQTIKAHRRTIKRIGTLLLIAAILFVFNKSLSKTSKGIVEDYARRTTEETVLDLIYIEDSSVALAAAPVGQADTLRVAKDAFNEVNGIRIANGLNPFKWSDKLEKASMIRATETYERFSHTRVDGTDYWSVDPSSVYAENISKGYRQSSSAVAAWMESEAHSTNLMDPNLSSMAIGVHEALDGNWYWVIEFGL